MNRSIAKFSVSCCLVDFFQPLEHPKIWLGTHDNPLDTACGQPTNTTSNRGLLATILLAIVMHVLILLYLLPNDSKSTQSMYLYYCTFCPMILNLLRASLNPVRRYPRLTAIVQSYARFAPHTEFQKFLSKAASLCNLQDSKRKAIEGYNAHIVVSAVVTCTCHGQSRCYKWPLHFHICFSVSNRQVQQQLARFCCELE